MFARMHARGCVSSHRKGIAQYACVCTGFTAARGLAQAHVHASESLQQGVAGGLPQLAGQLSAVLQDELGGDDPQVHGEQLVALDHLPLVVLAVEAQQLPANTHNGSGGAGPSQTTHNMLLSHALQ